MNNAQLAVLIINEGLPAALKIAEILNNPSDEVKPETIARLRELGARTAADYKDARQG